MLIKLPNDAVEKPHSETLFQNGVEFFQTQTVVFIFGCLLSDNMSLGNLPDLASLSMRYRGENTLLPASLSRITMIRQLLDIMHHAIQLPLPIHLGFSA